MLAVSVFFVSGGAIPSKKRQVWFRESGVDGDDVRMRSLDASSHVKASEPTFLERDLHPSGGNYRAEPYRVFSTFRLLKQGLIVNKSSILTDSTFA